jgi:predicted ATPase
VLIDRLEVTAPEDMSAWPFSVPAIQDVAEHGLRLTRNLVVFIGANGSGKSTFLLEAIAEAYGIDVRGGHGARRYGSYLEKGPSVRRYGYLELGQVVASRAATPRASSCGLKQPSGCWRT